MADPMSDPYDTFDPKLHDAAAKHAREVLARRMKGILPFEWMMARAYLDLVERRGLPIALRCYPSIQLISGEYFDFANPDKCKFKPYDIAHALSKVARCNGHTLGDDAYVVGQHCVHAHDQAPREFRFEALMHDAPEFVLGDITTPLKQLLPDFMAVEKRVEHAMARQFHLPFKMSPEVKLVDRRMAATEKRDLMPVDPPGESWESLEGIEPYDNLTVQVWSPRRARDEWHGRFHALWPSHQAMHAQATV